MIQALPRRRGLTRVEVLILLVVIVIVTALILPALRRAHHGENRVLCTSNLKQIGDAIWQYADIHNGALPPLSGNPIVKGRAYPQSFFFTILAHLQGERGYDEGMNNATTPGLTWTGHFKNGEIYNACFVRPYVCFADPTNSPTQPTAYGWVGASYCVNYQVFGTEDWKPKYMIRAIPDGTSNTVFVTERFAQYPGLGGRFTDPDGNPQQANSLWAWPANYPPNPPTRYTAPVPENAALFAYHNSTTGRGYGEVVFALPQFGVHPEEADYRRVQSGHRGVVQVGLGDGSVRTVSAQLTQPTWQNALTPDDGQMLGLDW